MYDSGMNTPAPSGGEVGSQMKAFLLLVFIFIGFIFLSATELGSADLTPYTPAQAAAPPLTEEDIVVIPDNNAAIGSTEFIVPVTGTCTDPYIVQPGDMLSSIAVICNTTIANIRLANPEITNANLIYPGQVLRISPVAVVQPTPIPVTGQIIEQPAPVINTAEAPQVDIGSGSPQDQPEAPATGFVPQIVPAIQPGTGMQVKGLNFPSNTPVHIAIGPLNTGYNVVANGITDANGNITATIVIPTAADPSEPWIVVVATISDPVIQAASPAFTIGQ